MEVREAEAGHGLVKILLRTWDEGKGEGRVFDDSGQGRGRQLAPPRLTEQGLRESLHSLPFSFFFFFPFFSFCLPP